MYQQQQTQGPVNVRELTDEVAGRVAVVSIAGLTSSYRTLHMQVISRWTK